MLKALDVDYRTKTKKEQTDKKEFALADILRARIAIGLSVGYNDR